MKRILLFCTLWVFAISAFAQEREVSGTVTSSDDNFPIPGVNILVKGTATGSITDGEGRYTIRVNDENAILVFSYIGFLTKEVPASGSAVDVVLDPDVKKLDEVVVTAFGIEREKKALGYAVTEVQGDDLTEAKEQNFVNSLSGKVPGLQVSQTGGGVGSSSRVVLRGFSSLTAGNNGVLYIVDGVPVDNTTAGQAGFAGGSDLGSPIADLNPEDIESISVLKGANAAALYGARAQNGVIMITTKKGEKKKGLGAQYSTNFTMENPLILPDLQNEYGQGLNDTARITTGDSWGEKMNGQSIDRFDGNGKVPYSSESDEFKKFFNTGTTWMNSLALDGGNDNVTYRFGYTNTDSKGIIPGSGLNRHAFTARAGAKLVEKLTADAKISFTRTNASNRQEAGATQVNVYRALLERPRSIALSDLENNYEIAHPDIPGATKSNNWQGGFAINPYYLTKHDINTDSRDRYIGLLSMGYEVTDWLSLQMRGAQDYSVFNQSLIYPIGGNPSAPNGRFSSIKLESTTRTFDAIASINKEFNETFKFYGSFGAVNNRFLTNRIGVLATDMIVPKLYTLNNYKTKAVTTKYTEKVINSVFGSGQIGYKNALFLEVTARNDWSSALPKGAWSFFYPSVTLSGVLTDLFEVDSKVLNYAKVRTSWAKVGNDTQPYRTRTTFNISPDVYNGLPLVYISNVVSSSNYEGATYGVVLNNPNLKPESTTSLELGADLWFFDKRLTVDATYYSSSTKDQIIPVPAPPSTGFEALLFNAGEVKNSGVELLISGIPIKKNDFSWQVSLNYAKNKSEIIELTEEMEDMKLAADFNNTVQVFASKGRPYGDLWVSTHAVDEKTGKKIYNSDGIPQIGEAKVAGNATPDFTAGINNTFTYKGVGLGFLIDMKMGGDLYSFSNPILTGSGITKKSLEGREGGIKVPGDAIVLDADGNEVELNDDVKKNGANAQDYWKAMGNIGEYWVYDASFVKLRQLTLSYSLPKSIIENSPFTQVKIGYVARNLALLYKDKDLVNLDPEASMSSGDNMVGIENFGLPTTRSHGIQLSVKF